MRVRDVDKTKKKDFAINKPMDDKDQVLENIIEGKRCTKPREDIRLWMCSISTLTRSPRKVQSGRRRKAKNH